MGGNMDTAHDGAIDVSSVPQAGTQFVVTLPRG
jgi:hypothetical protein